MGNNVMVVVIVLLFIAILAKPTAFLMERHQLPLPVMSSSSINLQSDVETVIADYQPVVFSIVATEDVPVINQCILQPAPLFEDPIFGDIGILRYCTVENQRMQTSGGTGFAVDSNGVILTNKHVVADDQAEYTVLFNDGKTEKVTKIYRDANTDVALVKVNRTLSPVATLGDSKNIKVGEFVVAIGNALGEYRNSASFGIVSGLNRSVTVGDQESFSTEKLEKVVQTDAAINPGNSGGPLIDLTGKVIALNTAKSAVGENIGFAIPIDSVKPIISNFQK